MVDTEYKVNNGQIAKIHVLLAKLGLGKEVKAQMVQQYTDGRETSTTKLSWKEAADLIKDLDGQLSEADPKRIDDLKADRKKKLILHYAHQMQWQITEEGKKPKIDMKRVNDWSVKYGMYHKPLNDHTVGELSKLVAQFEKVYKSYLNSI